MKKKGWIFLALHLLIFEFGLAQQSDSNNVTLKDGFDGKFVIGAALSDAQIKGSDTAALSLVRKQFNAIVAENCMKSGRVQPREGDFQFELADKFVDFGEQNNMLINGHTLIWHSQAPRWFFSDNNGQDVSREVLIQRMKDHINAVVGRYKGRVHTWDVVNEAIEDDGSWRKSKFYEIIGEEFIELAFQFAHEADPEAKLYYNDYSMANSGKRAGVVAMVTKLQEKGIQIDGVGMQGHIGLSHPSIEEFEKSILAFSNLGVDVMITELDLSVLPSPWRNTGADVGANSAYEEKMNPYPDGLPDSIEIDFNERFLAFFDLFLRHHTKISRVTFWGVQDGDSWKNNWPIRGRTDYPLLFDRNYLPKPIVQSVIDIAQ